MKKTTAQVELAAPSLYWVLAALLMAVAPHALRVPLPVTSFFGALLAWRYLVVAYEPLMPPRWLRGALTFAGIALVYNAYGTIVGRDAGVALLITMLGIKLLETTRRRDVYISVLIAYFLVVTHFLYSQSILNAAYMCAVVVVITATLIDVNRHQHTGAGMIRHNLRLAATLLLQAVPLMVVLFLLFPRIGTPLWGLPEDAYGARSGLSDEMAPGEISELGLSDEIAFRVSFDGAIPPSRARYWRGPVLWYTDGRRWRAAKPNEAPLVHTPALEPLGPPVTYTVTLEPQRRRWLFALDLPVAIPAGAQRTADFQLRASRDVNERLRYEVTSLTDYRIHTLDPEERARALQLPRGMNPQTQELAQRWAARSETITVVSNALRYFNEEPFIYTLAPQILNAPDPIDQFLFSTRQGFCEHYASAFVFLMRAAGIPARVVTGYQGGEFNLVGNYLVVRQRDAHAWAEVWLDGVGWQRIDPTAAVAPERIERSIRALPARIGEAVSFDLPGATLLRAFAERARQSWDSVNNGWNQWVLNYNQKQQQRLLQDLGVGIESWPHMILALVLAVIATTALVAAAVLWRRQQPQDKVVRLWQRFCKKLARRGLPRQVWEGPQDFATRVAAARPELKQPVQNIANLYIGLRYRRAAPQQRALLETFRRAVSRFTP
jgi:transglutaminase-like putative cysteine protease